MENKDSLKRKAQRPASPPRPSGAAAEAVETWEGEGGTATDGGIDRDLPGARPPAEEQH
jgi:hypothetical protein